MEASLKLLFLTVSATFSSVKAPKVVSAVPLLTDLRPDMAAINVPTLIIHGDEDQTVPIKATGEQAAQMISGAEFIVYEGEPHGLFITAKDQLNADLIDFISR